MFNSFQMVGGSIIRAPRQRITILRDVSFDMVQAYDFNTTTLINGNYYVKNYLNDGLTGNLRGTNRTTAFSFSGAGCLLVNTEPTFEKIYYTTDVGTTITFRFLITTNNYYATTVGGNQLNRQVDAQAALGFYLRCNNNLAFYPYAQLYVAALNNTEFLNRRYALDSDNSATSPYVAAIGTKDETSIACMMMDINEWCFIAITFGRQKNGTMDNKTMLLFSDVNSDRTDKVSLPPPSSVSESNISTTNASGITCSETFLNGTQISSGNLPAINLDTRFTDRVTRRRDVIFYDAFAIDDFRVYNRALTVDELKFEYNHTYTA
jgi:hypothetical protein